MKLKFNLFFFALTILFAPAISLARTYYVSPTGSDANVGYTIDAPFKSMKKALGKSDMTEIIVRGGTHYITGDSTVSINKIGAAPGAYTIRNYPGERPLFDCSGLNATKKRV